MTPSGKPDTDLKMLCYTVSSEFDDLRVADDFQAWLVDHHLADVCAAGALDAELVRLDHEPPRIEVRYHFASRQAFADYERDHAPRLRAEGLAQFPPERGVRMQRSLGLSVARRQRKQ
jgi:hypothetical protein